MQVIPNAAWHRPLGLPHSTVGKPHISEPIIDDGEYNGVPIGGMGAGGIGHTYRGDFARWHIATGHHHYEPRPACMFSVYMEQDGNSIAQALWTDAPDDGSLSSWDWHYPVAAGDYHALFPRAWFTYKHQGFPAELRMEQLSPFIPHNYRESSLPVGVFEWQATNTTDAPLTISIMLTWQNGIGDNFIDPIESGQVNELTSSETAIAMLMRHDTCVSPQKMGGTMAIATKRMPEFTITHQTAFSVGGDGSTVWEPFASSGELANSTDATTGADDQPIGTALAVKVTLAPGESMTVPFSVAWDIPVMHFGEGAAWYKRYTAFYGREGTHAHEIAADALHQYAEWREAISNWQRPILDDPKRPAWYKTALFNELYFLIDGGTIWEHGQLDDQPPSDDYLGTFMVMECVDYPHYATFDVDYQGSFALLELFPELEKRLMQEYVKAVPIQQDDKRTIVSSGAEDIRKAAGVVPHDLGGPSGHPWKLYNNYHYQNVNQWKDLNPQLPLRLYRNAVIIGATITDDAWAAIQEAMSYLLRFDLDGDGIPENGGFPDQTFDNWTATGISAYSGGLWVAALAVCATIAHQRHDDDLAQQYRSRFEAARRKYIDTLWRGSYFHYDASDSDHHDSIMAMQLAGQWYADLTGLDALDQAMVRSTLHTIFEFNVQKFGDGSMGAVNGMRPNGTVDQSSEQSKEMWTGSSYALASHLLLQGMDDAAWQVVYGVYRMTYELHGLWFRTPEAFTVDGNYRAQIYQRPLGIWAIETALSRSG